MSSEYHSSVDAPMFKIVSVWLAAIGIASWSELAAALAALYSILLIGEWFWKRFWRPVLEDRGIIKRLRRRRDDQR